MNFGQTTYLNNLRDQVPEEMKQQRRWVMWGHLNPKPNYAQDHSNWKKEPWQVPDQAGNIRYARSNQPTTWTNLATADYHLRKTFESQNPQFEGVGFVTGGGYIGIDIDHCLTYTDEDELLENPIVDQDVMDWMNSIGTYWEISPSRTGVHGFANYNGKYSSQLPNGKLKIEEHFPARTDPNRQRHFEFYLAEQYIRITGEVLDPSLFKADLPVLSHDNAAIDAFIEHIASQRNQQAQPSSVDMSTGKVFLPGPPLRNEQILHKLRTAANAEKFETLWNGGMLPEYNGDYSARDCGLASLILYYAGNESGRDLHQVVDLLLQSPCWASRPKTAGSRGKELAERAAKGAYNKLVNNPDGWTQIYRGTGKEESLPDGEAGLFNEDMLPLNLAKRLPFPLYTLPESMQRFCKEVARETSSSIDFTANGVLAMMSVPLASKVQIMVHEGHKSPVSLFMMLVGNASSGKSTAYHKLYPPLKEYEKKQRGLSCEKIEERKVDRKILEKKKKSIEAELDRQIEVAEGLPRKGEIPSEEDRKTAEKLVTDLKGKLIDVEEELGSKPELHVPEIYISGDITTERFITILEQQNGKLSIVNDEGSSFVNVLRGQYSKSPTIAPFINLFEGDEIKQHRIGREDVYIPHSSGSILLYAQLDVLEDFITTKSIRSQGLAGRFLIVEPEVSSIDEREDHSPADYQALMDYENLLLNLFALPDIDYLKPADTYSLKLSDGAYQLFEHYRIKMTNAGRSESGKYSDMSDVAGKHGNKALRLAAILHCMKYHDNPMKCPVSVDTMEKGIVLADYYLSHAEYILGGTGGDTADYAVRIIKKLRSLPEHPDILKVSDITRTFSKHKVLGRAKTIQPVLDFMEERNILATREDKKSSSRTKRSASGPYQVNQKIFTDEGLKQLGLDPYNL